MNKVLLKEFFSLCPNGACDITLLTEDEKKMKENGVILLAGKVAVADQLNGNNRIYPKKILEREISKYQEKINNNTSLGCLDHEDHSVINLREVSHLIKRLWWNGNAVYGVVQLLSTPNGKIAESLAKSNIPLGISTRALGNLIETPRGSVVDDSLELLCMDIVSVPSAPNAYLSLQEGKQVCQGLTKKQKLLECLNNILKG